MSTNNTSGLDTSRDKSFRESDKNNISKDSYADVADNYSGGTDNYSSDPLNYSVITHMYSIVCKIHIRYVHRFFLINIKYNGSVFPS